MREVPPWGKEHAVEWADPWEDLSDLRFADLAEILHLCLLDFARARKDLQMSQLRGSEGGGQEGALDRLAAARQLTERIREAPGYYEVSACRPRRLREPSDGTAWLQARYDLELVRVPGDSLARPFVPAVCVAFLAVHPLQAPELVSRVDQLGPQAVLERVSHQDAENLGEALEPFGFTTNIREAPARPADEPRDPRGRAAPGDRGRRTSRSLANTTGSAFRARC